MADTNYHDSWRDQDERGLNMNRMLRGFTLVLAATGLSGCEYINDVPLLGRYVAKNVCSGLLVSGYDAPAIQYYASNIAPPFQKSWNISVDQLTGSVSVRNRWLPAFATQTAVPVAGDSNLTCRNHFPGVELQAAPALIAAGDAFEFADGAGRFPALQQLVESAVNAGAPAHTTAMLVIHDQQVVAEAYGDGIDADSPLKGFSMSKSLANLLVGRLADQGLLDVQDPLPLAAWQRDERARIRWDDSLRMSSGLLWNEASVGSNNQQGILFYGSADPAAYASESAAVAAPATLFNYSSADFTNIATALVEGYPHWFDPGWNLGGPFALDFSPDNRYPLLGEGVLLTTRGWAQLASIYMHEGRLGDSQILSPEWVQYSLTPSATNFDYGAGIWLNRGQALYPQLPADAFAFLGSYDRAVVAIPSRQLIVVRIGFSAQPGDFNMEDWMVQVLALLPVGE
jgi:CubicO group peptidase (beta-lactamase class C family)